MEKIPDPAPSSTLRAGMTLLALLVVAGGIGFGVYWTTARSSAPAARRAAAPLELVPDSYDFGLVSESGGEVSTTFTLRNASHAELVLHDLDTSCGCTEAAVVVNGEEGPRFNMRMHGRNPQGWSVTLAPGAAAELRVYYNPQVHPDLRGPVTREVYLFGENLQQPLATARIYVYQTD